MIDTLVRIDRFLQARWVTADNGARYDANRNTRVSSLFFPYIINALIAHYTAASGRNNNDLNTKLLAAVQAIKADVDAFFHDDGLYVIMKKHKPFKNPTIDVIEFLLERYENSTTDTEDMLYTASSDLEDDLLNDHLARYEGIINYPWRWDQVDRSGTTPYVPPPQTLPPGFIR